MNQTQRGIIVAAAVVVALMMVYPPHMYDTSQGEKGSCGYRGIWQDHADETGPCVGSRLDLVRLSFQCAAVLIVAAGLVFAAADTKDKQREWE